jgi:hypothetical protein
MWSTVPEYVGGQFGGVGAGTRAPADRIRFTESAESGEGISRCSSVSATNQREATLTFACSDVAGAGCTAAASALIARSVSTVKTMIQLKNTIIGI